MKKSITLVLALLLMIISGCAQNHTASITDIYSTPNNAFTIYNISAEMDALTEDYNNIAHSPLWSLRKSASKSASAPKTATITFEGKTYSGEFWYSAVVRHNPYTSHYYLFHDGWFSIKSSTGEVDCIYFTSPSYTKGTKSAEDCKESALALADQYINTKDYKLTVETTADFHSYLFERYIENVRTDAFLSVGITTNGELLFFSYGSTDELDAAVSQFDEETLKSRIALYTSGDVVSAICNEQNKSTGKSVEIMLDAPVLVVLEDGALGVIYDMSVELIEREGDLETHISNHAQYLVGPYVSE